MKLFGKYRFDVLTVDENDRVIFNVETDDLRAIEKFREKVNIALKFNEVLYVPSNTSVVVLKYHKRAK